MPTIDKRYAVLGKFQTGCEWFVRISSDTFRDCTDHFVINMFAYDEQVMVTNDGEVIYEFVQRSL